MGQARQHDGHRGAAGAALASNTRIADGQPSHRRRPVMDHDGVARATAVTPFSSVFSWSACFSYLMFLLGASLRGFLEKNRGSFRLGLALITPLGRNKVVRLGLF